MAILVLCQNYIEDRQDRRHDDEEGRVHKMTPGTDPLSNSEIEITGSSRKVLSSLRKRSGLNASGSGYKSGLCRIALTHHLVQKDI